MLLFNFNLEEMNMNFIKKLVYPNNLQLPVITSIGVDQDPTSMNNFVQALTTNALSSAGGINFSASSATSGTITNLGYALYQWTAGAGTTVTIDSAYNICAKLPQPLSVGQKFDFQMQTTASTTIATPSLAPGATTNDVTLAGTTSMLASAVRYYQGTITQVSTSTMATYTSGTTFTSLTQVGSTNLFTIALGTNTISPTVGTLIHINVTTGTLPSGWYPIVGVTSATSFVIATPVGTTWTATAATLDSTAPSAAVYAPLVTITGLYTIGASAAV